MAVNKGLCAKKLQLIPTDKDTGKDQLLRKIFSRYCSVKSLFNQRICLSLFDQRTISDHFGQKQTWYQKINDVSDKRFGGGEF